MDLLQGWGEWRASHALEAVAISEKCTERDHVHAAGMARFTCHDPHNVYDVIPCDLVASNILVSACALTQVRLAIKAPQIRFHGHAPMHPSTASTGQLPARVPSS